MGDISDALKRGKPDPKRTGTPNQATQDVDPASVRPARPAAARADLSQAAAADPRSASAASALGRSADIVADATDPSPIAEQAKSNERLVIPREKTGSWVERMVVVSQKGGAAEAYRHFALRVSRELDELNQKSVILVSALRLEGKTTTSCNLALALSSMAGGRKIALVDLDLRRPSLGRSFGIQAEHGVEDVLYGNCSLPEACVPTDLMSLDLFPVHKPIENPHELLSGPPLVHLMRDLHTSYDLVVIDSPPILLVPDTALILPHVGSCVAVLRSRQTRKESFEQMLGMLPPQKLIGTFLNDAHLPKHSKEYGYYLGEDERPPPEPV